MHKSQPHRYMANVRRAPARTLRPALILSLLVFMTAMLLVTDTEAAMPGDRATIHGQAVEQTMLHHALLAFAREDYARAHARLLPLAQNGDVEAQFYLGSLYDAGGNGIEANAAMAAHWFQRAARHGHVDAQYNMGVAYANGDGVVQDTVNAVRWWRRAANNGSLNAQFNLGIVYLRGDGIRQDANEAFSWWQMAARQGDPAAQFNLGALYANGQGVTADMQKALMWWRRAADQGFAQAIQLLRERPGMDEVASRR